MPSIESMTGCCGQSRSDALSNHRSDFARAAHVHPASVYNALNGSRVRDSTAIRIFETLEKRQPMSVAIA